MQPGERSPYGDGHGQGHKRERARTVGAEAPTFLPTGAFGALEPGIADGKISGQEITSGEAGASTREHTGATPPSHT